MERGQPATTTLSTITASVVAPLESIASAAAANKKAIMSRQAFLPSAAVALVAVLAISCVPNPAFGAGAIAEGFTIGDVLDESWGWFIVVGLGARVRDRNHDRDKGGGTIPRRLQTSEWFNTAGRVIKTGLTAAAIVSAWTWAATLLQSSTGCLPVRGKRSVLVCGRRIHTGPSLRHTGNRAQAQGAQRPHVPGDHKGQVRRRRPPGLSRVRPDDQHDSYSHAAARRRCSRQRADRHGYLACRVPDPDRRDDIHAGRRAKGHVRCRLHAYHNHIHRDTDIRQHGLLYQPHYGRHRGNVRQARRGRAHKPGGGQRGGRIPYHGIPRRD